MLVNTTLKNGGLVRPLLWLALASGLSACGGGDGSSSNDTVTLTNNTDTTWVEGEFRAPSYFADQCESPRSGIDPATGSAYPDTAGSALIERHYLRSWSNETYLWYDEIVDRNPALYDNTEEYFSLLKTDAVTASGNAKDNFHFSMSTTEWNQLSQSGTSVGYGAMWSLIRNSPPRELRVAYVEPKSPAAAADITRGATVLTIDGVDVANGSDTDTLNAGLSPSTDGESHVFEIQDLDGAIREVTLTAKSVTSQPVLQRKVLEDGVGYIVFNDHIATAEEQLIEAVEFMQAQTPQINDLVLDVRYNGGGYLAIASQLAYMIAGPTQTADKPFEATVFNDKHSAQNSEMPFYSETVGLSSLAEGQALPYLGLPRVFVITGPDTCSASEAIINGLRGVDVEVIQIGSTTCGKPYGFYPEDNCGTTYFTIQFTGENAKGFGEYPDGFSPANTLENPGEPVPGCYVPDDFNNLLGDPAEERLATALHYLSNGDCAYSAASSTTMFSKPSTSSGVDGRLLKSPALQGRALHKPPGE